MATTLYDNARRNYAATNQTRYKNAYRRRLMDRCILNDLCNSNPENIKGFLGVGKGSKVEMYIPGTVKVRETGIDGGIIYQQMTDTYETYGINHECYWALKFRPEDKAFMPWDPKSEYFTNATDMMARHMEKQFGAFIPNAVPTFNQGAAAGVKFGTFDLGTEMAPVRLHKTTTQFDADTTDSHKDVAVDFMVKMANTLRQNEGLSGYHVNLVINSIIRHQLETSELKFEGIMGRNTDLGSGQRGGRNEVKFLGTLDDTIGVIQDDIMFEELQQKGAAANVAAGGDGKVYPIFAMMSDACAFVHDTIMRDNAMKDIQNWDEHYRAKEVYDFPVLFPQMLAIGWVKIA